MDILQHRDLKHIWHPCTQMKDMQQSPPLPVAGASGCYIELTDGRRLLDAISSWWCKSLGHGHPRLQQALQEQLSRAEHTIFANTTHEVVVQLAERLSQLQAPLDKIQFASDGSSAVEIALKMSLHYRQIQGQSKRQQFIALANGYHGETVGAMSVSDLGLYRSPYQALCFPCHFIQDIPYVSHQEDPVWTDCSAHWPYIEAQLAPLANTTTAIIVEPIVQGAGGMKIYSQDFLRRLAAFARTHGIHLIADEIMTGLGRTGLPLACQHADIQPDFLCLSKNLSSGFLPLSVMLTHDDIYQAFYDDYQHGHNFLHSHTFSGNPLAASVALACLQCFEDENIYQHIQQLGPQLAEQMQAVAQHTGRLRNIRHLGAMVAADLMVPDDQRYGVAIYQAALSAGLLLRPIGNTIYWVPPLNMPLDTIDTLRDGTIQAINQVFNQ